MLQETMERLALVSNPRVAAILRAAAEEFHISVARMVSRERTPRDYNARLLAMAALDKFTWLSWMDMARALNRRQGIFQKRAIQKAAWIPSAVERIADRLRAEGVNPDREHVAAAPLPVLRTEAPDINTIIAIVCAQFDINYGDLTGHGKTQKMIVPRIAAIHALRTFMALSTPRIGQILGDRDHSTIVYHLQRAAKYPWLPTTLRDIEAQLAAAVNAQVAA